MSVLMRMEMPENCQRCELFALCTGKCKNEVIRFDGKNIDKKDRRCLFICQLPEGHGRLIDAEKLKAKKYHSKITRENAVSVAEIDWAETIVPADTERSET